MILLRHGESESNAAGLLVGRSDPQLTDLGKRQARAAGESLAAELARAPRPNTAPIRPPLLVTSPLERARVTAHIVAEALAEGAGLAVEVSTEERLIELDYGELDGKALNHVDPVQWAAWRADPSWRPPGGETLEEVDARVSVWCESLVDLRDRDVIAVSHVSPIKSAVGWSIGAGPELSWRLSLGVATLTRIRLSPLGLISFGETGHLASSV
ncbi:MAG: histidine phosphatase family protein [Acidimicrobiales bacterium]